MFSLKTSVFFLSCIAVAVAFPPFFKIGIHRNAEGDIVEPEPTEQPYREAPANQQTGESSVFSEADAAQADSNSAEVGETGPLGGETTSTEVDGDADGSVLDGSDVDTPDSPDTGGAVVAGGAQGGNNAGDTSSTPSPNLLNGSPGLIVHSGKGSSPGTKFGIAFAVLTVVGLAAGGAFYAYRKRRAAAYGSRF